MLSTTDIDCLPAVSGVLLAGPLGGPHPTSDPRYGGGDQASYQHQLTVMLLLHQLQGVQFSLSQWFIQVIMVDQAMILGTLYLILLI